MTTRKQPASPSVDLGARTIKVYNPVVTGPDGTEHKCQHWGHLDEKAAKACSRKLARDNGIELETPSTYRREMGTSDEALTKAVREHFGDSAQALTDDQIVQVLGWVTTPAGAYAKVRPLITAEAQA